jgi:hypothetical protein
LSTTLLKGPEGKPYIGDLGRKVREVLDKVLK